MTRLPTVLLLVLVAHPVMAQDSYAALPGVETLPEGIVQISGVVPAMGEHWADPARLPLGPIYCVHQGKVVCLEFVMAQDEFASGQSWPMLAGMAGLPAPNHTDIGFQPAGHEGFEVPHYDIHMYFLSPEEVAQIQPE
jgi:hypothetical protein